MAPSIESSEMENHDGAFVFSDAPAAVSLAAASRQLSAKMGPGAKAKAEGALVQQEQGGDAADGGKNASACRCCDEIKAKGSPFCARHKRAYQCIQNRCLKKNKEGKYIDEDSAANFHKIFGEGRTGPPNMTMANQVVLDFCRENPDCKESAGKKRGANFNLNKYVNRVYAAMSQAKLEDDCLWDEEIFVNKFKALRGWSQDHSRKMFQQLVNDPKVYKDQEGFGGATRVAVPPSWTGEEKQRKKREVGEERVVERTTKTARITGQDYSKAVEELDTGFQFRDTSGVNAPSSSWTSPLPSAAITNMDTDGGVTAVQIVANLAKKVVADGKGSGYGNESVSHPAATAAGQDAAVPNVSPSKSETQNKKVGSFDIERLKVSRTLEATIQEHEKKMVDNLKKAWAAVCSSEASADEDLLHLIKERALIAIHWLGAVPVGLPARGADALALDMQSLEYDEEDFGS